MPRAIKWKVLCIWCQFFKEGPPPYHWILSPSWRDCKFDQPNRQAWKQYSLVYVLRKCHSSSMPQHCLWTDVPQASWGETGIHLKMTHSKRRNHVNLKVQAREIPFKDWIEKGRLPTTLQTCAGQGQLHVTILVVNSTRPFFALNALRSCKPLILFSHSSTGLYYKNKLSCWNGGQSHSCLKFRV